MSSLYPKHEHSSSAFWFRLRRVRNAGFHSLDPVRVRSELEKLADNWQDLPLPAKRQRMFNHFRHLTLKGANIIEDTKRKLWWARSLSPASMDWQEAFRYVRMLVLDDESGWRLPTIIELKTLFHPQERAFPPLFRIERTGYWTRLWSSTSQGLPVVTVSCFDVSSGDVTERPPTETHLQVLAVCDATSG